MKFSIGDRVLLKRTGEEGFITAFLSKQLVEVEVADTRFPVYADELEHPYLKWFTDPNAVRLRKIIKEIPEEKVTAKKMRLSRGIYLSFLPQFVEHTNEDIVAAFRIHLLNETADAVSFAYHAKTSQGNTHLQLNGSIHPFGSIYLHTLSLEEMNAQPRFYWELATKDKPDQLVKDVLRIRPAQLVKHIKALLHEGLPSFNILLTQDAEGISAGSQPAEKADSIASSSQQDSIVLHTAVSQVLDLHPEQLDVEVDKLSASEVLETQISLLKKKLDVAYAASLDSMIIIHGIGNGTLRTAVKATLVETPFVQSFRNEWMAAFGWGATEVFFRPH